MIQFLSLILAVSEAIPQLKAMIDMLFELRIQYQRNKDESEDVQKTNERLALLNSMKRAQNDEERKVIARLLYRNYRRV